MVRQLLTLFLLQAALLVVHGQSIELTPIYPGLECKEPVALVVPNDGTRRKFLVEQGGLISILPQDAAASEKTTFLDLTKRPLIDQAFEEGLLGFAFHPEFSQNGTFYLYYTLQDPKHSVVSEMKVLATNPNEADPSSERILLRIPQPFWNHNSGNLIFGPDGMLYIAVGDGGKRDDPLNLAQNPFMLNGKILRIDVDERSGSRPYGIPNDNPFIDTPGKRPEIYALGLRNPWGITFHPESGLFLCADVGQNLWEEINVIVSGGNYGWSHREGAHSLPSQTEKPAEDLTLIDPIHEYTRDTGISITGGIFYRGHKRPELKGAYIYGDWGNGNLWALKVDAEGKALDNRPIFTRPESNLTFRPTAFCENADQEMIILSWDGKLYTL